MITRDRIRVRDPFVLLREDTYYLYASERETALSCYTSMEKAGSSEVRPYSFGAAEDSPRSFPVSDRKGNGAKENYP